MPEKIIICGASSGRRRRRAVPSVGAGSRAAAKRQQAAPSPACAVPRKPDRQLAACPACESPIGPEHQIIDKPIAQADGSFRCRVRIYCEFCEAVLELAYETVPQWRLRGDRAWHDMDSAEGRSALRTLSKRRDARVRVG